MRELPTTLRSGTMLHVDFKCLLEFFITDQLNNTILSDAGTSFGSWCWGLIGFQAELLIDISQNAIV